MSKQAALRCGCVGLVLAALTAFGCRDRSGDGATDQRRSALDFGPGSANGLGSVEGTVSWNGAPVTGAAAATLAIEDASGNSYPVDPANGRYLLTALSPGEAALRVRSTLACNTPLLERSVTITAGGVASLDFDLTSVAGKVVGVATMNGAPAGAVVGIGCAGVGTDATGGFAALLPPGTWNADLYQGDVRSVRAFTTSAGVTTDIGALALESGSVAGTVSWNGIAVDGSGGEIAILVDQRRELLDGQGRYAVSNLVTGTHTLAVAASCFSEPLTSTNISTPSGSPVTADLDITSSAGRVSGTLTLGGSAAAASGMYVTLDRCVGVPLGTGGRLASLLPPGQYVATIRIFGSGIALNTFTFTIQAGQTTELGDVAVAAGGLRGTVTWNGAPATNAPDLTIVELDVVNSSVVFNRIAVVDATGAYTSAPITPGTYAPTAGTTFCNSMFMSAPALVTVPEGPPVTANLDITAFAGRLTGSFTIGGAPVPPSASVVVSTSCLFGGSFGYIETTVGGLFGRLLPRGRYAATVTSGGQIGLFVLDVVGGQTTDVGALTADVGSLTGSVFWDGERVSGPEARSLTVGGIWVGSCGGPGICTPFPPRWTATPNDLGRFDSGKVVLGDYSVSVSGPACQGEEGAGGTFANQRVTLESGGTGFGLDITGRAGRLVGSTTIAGVPVSATIELTGDCGVLTSDASGRFGAFLSPGDYNAVVSTAAAGRIGSFSFTIRAGETTNLDTLPPGVCVPPPSGIVSWWPGEGDGRDLVGGRHGTLEGNAGFSTEGMVGRAFAFDGSVGSLVRASAVGLPTGTSPRTVELWTKLAPDSDDSGLAFGYGAENDGQGFYLYAQDPSDGSFGFGDHGNLMPTIADLRDGEWHHLAIRYDGFEFFVYVDGVVVDNDDWDLDTGTAGGACIGGHCAVNPAVAYLTGLVDEVTVYDRMLTVDELHAIHDAGPGGKCRPPASPGTPCASGNECASGRCVDGVCCSSDCGGGVSDCQACSVAAGGTTDGTCTALTTTPVCRSSAGPCDVEERCSPTSIECPADGFVAAGTTCYDATNNLCASIERTLSCADGSPTCPTPTPWPTNGCKAATCAVPAPPAACTRAAGCNVELLGGLCTAGGVSVTFSPPPAGGQIAAQGPGEFVSTDGSCLLPPTGFGVVRTINDTLGQYWNIDVSPGFVLPATTTICVRYTRDPAWGSIFNECSLKLFHGANPATGGSCTPSSAGWMNITDGAVCPTGGIKCGTTSESCTPNTICGTLMVGDHFSPFAVFAPLPSFTPAITVPGDMIVEATSPAGATVTFVATATDPTDGALDPVCTPASGSTFAIGTTTVTCTATNSLGISASASFTVTVPDTTRPVFTNVPGTIVALATTTAGAIVTYELPTATDGLAGPVPVICTPASGSTFAPGQKTVDCTASDAWGNTATASFMVRVQYQAPADGSFFLQPINPDGS